MKNGLDKILYSDLTRPELGASVVWRIVIPTNGTLFHRQHPVWRPLLKFLDLYG